MVVFLIALHHRIALGCSVTCGDEHKTDRLSEGDRIK